MTTLRFNKLTGLALAAVIAGGSLAPAAFAQEAAPAPAAAEAAAPATPAAAPPAAEAAAPVAEAAAAPAPEAAAPTVDKGDTTWMLVSTVLVLLMIIPGLALFYGGLVRQKNMLSMLMQVSTVTVIGMIAWLFYGYSLAFTDGGSLDSFVGGAGRLFLKDVTPSSLAATFSTGVAIPELVFICFQMTFACITAALVLGGVAERMKFAAVVAFAILWPLLSYYPMAHMVWWWAGPDAVAANPTAPIQSGLLWGFGALDFAGGTVVHINAGIAALVGALIVGPRKGFGSEAMPPHSLTLTLVGAGLLWVGWFGFNAGSNLEANGYAALAMINTLVATAAAGISWVAVEWLTRGKASMLGLASGLVAGLVAVTPAAGFSGPVGAVILGLVVSPICVFFCSTIKNALKYDDSLDAFGIHAVGGIVGAIATGLLVNPAWGGAGVVDYTTCALDGDISTCDTAAYVMSTQVLAQVKAVLVAIGWSGVMSSIVFFVIKYTIGLRPSVETEEEGLDITEHGERAYHS
ncbi:MAG: ammonia channel protein [Phenylobacterium sp.]|uniref:ammonium transporter n=1 Tax=Phenylobacterium sp. TaxID=1871053 RepID=UPI0025EEA06E|nr:ammonium transporter [Phenylobacterium sp.]MBA4014165.1 ammonia channel protein [Phenylobacterium sp.]